MIAAALAILPWVPAMVLLILLSAFFSGSEAALFSLQPRDRRELKKNKVAWRQADRLLSNPERLLSAVLFWNLVINMAYFGIVSIISKKIESVNDAQTALVFSLLSLLTIIFFSEMLPKSVAVSNPVRSSTLIVAPLGYAIRLISPALPMLQFANLMAQRIIWPSFQPECELELDDIDRAIRLSAPDDAFADRERELLRRLILLTDVRVDEWMRPRSQYQLHQFPLSDDALSVAAQQGGYLFISDESGNEIAGTIAVNWLRPSQMDDLSAAVDPPLIVPWTATVASVFDALRQEDRDVAAVVNEYGESIGLLSIEDVLEAVMLAPNEGIATDNGNGNGDFQLNLPLRIDGSMSARELAKQLNVPLVSGRHATVAGLMQTLSRRFPHLGDVCNWNGYKLVVVEEVDKGKIEIEVSVEDDQELSP